MNLYPISQHFPDIAKLINSTYPNRDLTGVGVAFKLAHAVTSALIEQEKITPTQVDLKNYLDLVALGTIADMGALRGENRTQTDRQVPCCRRQNAAL